MLSDYLLELSAIRDRMSFILRPILLVNAFTIQCRPHKPRADFGVLTESSIPSGGALANPFGGWSPIRLKFCRLNLVNDRRPMKLMLATWARAKSVSFIRPAAVVELSFCLTWNSICVRAILSMLTSPRLAVEARDSRSFSDHTVGKLTKLFS